jgi:hypothetical protein
MLTMHQFIGTPGPVIERGECHFVYLPSGELRECDGLADGSRQIDDWWQQRGGERDEPNCNGRE